MKKAPVNSLEFRTANTIPNGEYVKCREGATKVYQLTGWCRVNRRYELVDQDDASNARYVPATAMLFVGFTH